MTRTLICVAILASAICGQSVLFQSLPSDWSHVHATPYWTDDVPTSESTYGFVDLLNFVWWLEWFSPTINLPAGTYGARVRLKKLSNISGRYDLTLSQNGTSNQVVLAAGAQAVDTWVWTPDLEFTVPAGGGSVAFRFHNLNGSQKQNYWFDMFEIRQADFQTNRPEASSDCEGVISNGFDPAISQACTGNSVDLSFSSTEIGQPWDFGYAFAAAQGGSQTGMALGSGQVINIDILDPTFQYFNGGTFTTPFAAAFTLPVTVPAGGTASMQSAHIAPAHPDGFGLSQASQLDILASAAPVTLAIGDDVVILVQHQLAPYCGTMPAINFYGTSYTYFWVCSNGQVQFSFPAPSPLVNQGQFTTWMPRACGMWSDLAPNVGGSVTLTASSADVKVSFTNVATAGIMNTASNVDITFTSGGSTIIDNYNPDPGHTFETLVGITRGGGSTNPGPMSGTAAGTILGNMGLGLQTGLATDCIFESVVGGTPAAGWTSLEFPNSDGSQWIVN
ncbi:MAG: hypothetical protein VX913_03420 [Planctomycetota bacterium]|nr:hypothetical protein [Planctomycetota bacterium]